MSHSEHVDVGYLARAEGETAIRVELAELPAIELKIFEPPRFFEGFLVGRRYDEVGDIVSRICGICPVSHMTTAIQAIEKAMAISIGPQTKILRDIMTVSQICASHLVHMYMLAMPDYYGYSGFNGMLTDFKEETGRLVKMKELVNKITGVIGGRALHPVTHLPGGFTRMPKKEEFAPLIEQLKAVKDTAGGVVADMARLDIPDFHCRSEYVALYSEDEYAVNEGRIRSTGGLDIAVGEYERVFQESQTRHAYAKYSQIRDRSSFMVGALARLNIKFDKLREETRQLARQVGFSVPADNPYLNNLAQSLEVYDGIGRCLELMEAYREEEERMVPPVRGGEGCSLTEAPRGLLYHRYKIDSRGVVREANIVTPTSHNFLNIEKDLLRLVDENKGQGRDKVRLLCEELVRAYDPCFSCSVH